MFKVLTVTNLWPEDGSFRGIFVREQVESLRRRGHTVDVEVVGQSGPRAGALRALSRKAEYLTAAPRVRRRARGYDLVHVHYGLTALAGRFTGGTPRVLSLYGSDVNTPWQHRLTSLSAGAYAARIYVSQRLADSAGDPAGLVIPNGVDFGLFTPIDRGTARALLGLDPTAPIVLFGGARENAVKGYDVFRAALDRLGGAGLPAQELILAAPDQPREAVAAKFAAADVLLFTSRQGAEGSPTVVKEAAVMGLPVVTVDVGDVRSTLDGVSPSAVVPFPSPADPDELVRRLAERTGEILAEPRRSNGRERNAHLDATLVAERIEAVYRRVMA